MPKKNSFRRNAVSVAIATALAGGVQPAIAQDEPGIEEITVTASRRAESIQDVSLSVTALSESDLKLGGIEDITRLEHLVPWHAYGPVRQRGAYCHSRYPPERRWYRG